ncbi:phosphonate ABC transporter, permease protein PhnE [Rhodoferax sp.]|uniref:phosphonate ABC transporter, permease protein PhnE n=1 Tax=Rhodoferax sp. TaxID=50421 RepID=UPI00260511FA|nr:phosphonate ABC transporter, permease protein PhnE [Rhodoferax sp.]MDD2925497.1 phosphonate ABC transporter, permease protein PhnE [Rhodoferax sp.]
MSTLTLREWQRFTAAERLSRFAVYFGVVLAIVLSLKAVNIIPEFLADAHTQMQDLLLRMWPVEWSFYLEPQNTGAQSVHAALMDTLAIAFMSTALGLLLATPVGFLAARNINRIGWLNAFARFILIATRSISTLLWALFFVAMFGPGALAGTCAIAFHSIGFIGKMLSEALEEANRGAIEALTATGAPWYSRIIYGYWPQVQPAFASIALFRWDINVRESAVLGLVGAGGIGMALNSAIDVFEWNKVSLVLLVILAVVVVAEVVATQLRKRLI